MMAELIARLDQACIQLIGIACGTYMLKCALPSGGLQGSARKALDIAALTAAVRIIAGVLNGE